MSPVVAALMAPHIRAATTGDIPEIRRLLRAHDNDSEVAPGGIDIVGPYVRHLVDHHVVRVSVDADKVVGFAAALDTGWCRMLSDLFVDPDRLGQGIGRPLLDAVFDGVPARATFASDDPRAIPLYVRAGMTPLWTDFYLDGDARALPVDGRLRVRAALAGEGADLELAWDGADRAIDHAYWASGPEGDAFVVDDELGPAAIGYARARQLGTARVVDRLLLRPGADPVATAVAALRRAARDNPVLRVQVPGPSQLLPALLEARFRIVDRDQFLASDASLVDPARLLPNPGML
jgi:GNAT superfamily N-acetyltransferase